MDDCRREVPKKTRMTAPEVKVNTDEADVKKCAARFESCGWDPLDFDPRYAFVSHPAMPQLRGCGTQIASKTWQGISAG